MVNGPLSGLLVDCLIFVGNIFNRIKLGFSYDDASVSRAIENTEVPLLIVHSRADEITPYFMGKNIYEAVEHENKNILTVETSEHGNIHRDYPQKYENKIMSLINDLDD